MFRRTFRSLLLTFAVSAAAFATSAFAAETNYTPKTQAAPPAAASGAKAGSADAAKAGTAAAPAATAKKAAAKPASGDPILVGHFGSTTGPEATFGQSTDKGILLAAREFNEAGGFKGRPVKVITYDDQGKSQEAQNAVTRLITQDKVTAVLGEVASSLSIAGGQVAQKYKVPMISPSSTNERVTKIGNMISRVCFVDSFQGYVMAKFAQENLKAKNVAILYDQKQAYSKGLKDDFKKAFEALGGTVATEQAYSGGDQDYNAQLTTIREAKVDGIYIPGYYTDVGNIAIQARKLGITVPLMGGDGWDSSKLGEIGGAAIEGSYYSNHYSADDTRPEVQEFVKKFREAYNETPDGLAALGYDAARVLFDAFGRSPSLGGEDLAKAIASTKDFPGVTGKITIDENRNARKAAVVVQVKNGRPVFVRGVDPQK